MLPAYKQYTRILPLLLFFGSGYALARTPAVPQMPPGDPLLAPLRRGDAKLVHRIEDRVSAGPVTRAMDQAQLSYDMPRLYSAALRCQAEGLKGGSKDDLWTGWYCSHLVRSSALIRGDALAYLREVKWIRDRLFRAMDATSSKHVFHFGNQLDAAAINELVSGTGPLSATWTAPSDFLRFTNQGNGTRTRTPSVSIKVNGHAVPAFVDTGPSVLRTPVTIVIPSNHKSALVHKLGLVHVLDNYWSVSVGYDGANYKHIEPSLYTAGIVAVGPLTLHHLAIGEISINAVPPGIYLSNSMWRKFGRVVFSRSGVSLSRSPDDQCTPALPLTFASSYFQLGSALFPVQVEGAAKSASLWLGVPHRVAVGPDAVAGMARAADDAPGTGHDPVASSVTFRIGGRSFNMRDVHIVDDWSYPFQVMFGRPILATHKVSLRLRGGHPSICFAPYDQ